MLNDGDLIREFVDHGADDAFRTLVERHSGMVHAAALRIVRDPHVAADVTQAVFLVLARKASSLPRRTILAGWLYRTTRFVALEAIRSERRRQERQEQFVLMNAPSPSDTHSLWDQVAPLLDEALCRLGEAERNAILLRFLEGRSFAELANGIGTTEAAAKMRVGRALEKLRSVLARSGVVVPAATLLALLSAHGASAAPPGLPAAVAASALASHAATDASLSGLAKAALTIMTWNKIKVSVITGAIALLLTGGAIYLLRPSPSPATASPPPTDPPLIVASLDPMAGEWRGTFERRVDGSPNAVTQPIALSIRTSQAGHLCEIEMRVLDAAQETVASYEFTHTLNAAGNRITTADDPQVAWMSGEGEITEGALTTNNVWRVGFRTPHRNGGGHSECLWVRQGDELHISRKDRINGPQGSGEVDAVLRLRPAGAKAAP